MTEQIDMTRFVEAKSDQLNSDDLIGAERTITITKVTGSDSDQPIAIHYEGDNRKPWKPCKSMRRVLLGVWGRYANDYVGRSLTLYRDDTVTWGGLEVGGIRIKAMSHIDKKTIVVIAKAKGKKAGIEIMPLAAEKSAEPTQTERQRWEGWSNKLTAALKKCADVPALDAILDKQEVRLDELAAKHPDLHGEVVRVSDECRAFMASDDGGEV